MEEQVSELLTDVAVLKMEIDAANEQINNLKHIVGTMATWLSQELGHTAVVQLLDKIDDV